MALVLGECMLPISDLLKWFSNILDTRVYCKKCHKEIKYVALSTDKCDDMTIKDVTRIYFMNKGIKTVYLYNHTANLNRLCRPSDFWEKSDITGVNYKDKDYHIDCYNKIK